MSVRNIVDFMGPPADAVLSDKSLQNLSINS